MAAPSATELQAQIVREVSDPNATVAPVIAVLWNMSQPRGDVDSRLQYLYTKRAALDIRLGEEQANTDFNIRGDVQDSQSQRFTHLERMRNDCQKEIERVEILSEAQRPPAYGAILATEIVPVPTDARDPNDLIGSPFTRLEDR